MTVTDVRPKGTTADDAGSDTPVPEPTARSRNTIPLTEHGFREGTDSAIIVDILVAGGLDRQDINEKVAAAINVKTRNGRMKNIPSLISGLLARLEERGYYIESSWRVVPPATPQDPQD